MNTVVATGSVHCRECGRDLPYLPIPDSPLICPCGSEWLLESTILADLGPRLVIRQTERSIERGDTYVIIDVLEPSGSVKYRYIMCLRGECPAHGRPSYSMGDIMNRYCGGCHTFHERAH